MHLDNRKRVPGLHPGLNDLIRVLGKQAHCASRTLIICERSCMSSYSDSKYHKSCTPPKEAKPWRTSCRPSSLWSPVPPETFYHDCFFYRQYPERDLEYYDIKQKYDAAKREKHVGDEEVVTSTVKPGNVTGDAGLGGKIHAGRSIPRGGQRGARSVGCTGPNHLKSESSRSKKYAEGELSFKGIALSDHEPLSSCSFSELGEIMDLLEKSDKETARILREMFDTMKELSLRDKYRTAFDANELSMTDTVRSISKASALEVEMIASEPREPEISPSTCKSSLAETWEDLVTGEFDLDSSNADLNISEFQPPPVPDPARNLDASSSEQMPSCKYDSSSRSETFVPVPVKTSQPGETPRSGPLRNGLNQTAVTPNQSVSTSRYTAAVPSRSGSALTLLELFELSSQMADVIVLETCLELGRNGMIPLRRRDQRVPGAYPATGDKLSNLPEDSASSCKSEGISDLGHSGLDEEMQPPMKSQEALDESSTRSDMNEGPPVQLDASAQDTRNRGRKYALLALPIFVMLVGGIYTLFRK